MKNGKIRFLSGEDLEKTLPMAEAIRAVKDAFLQLSNGEDGFVGVLDLARSSGVTPAIVTPRRAPGIERLL